MFKLLVVSKFIILLILSWSAPSYAQENSLQLDEQLQASRIQNQSWARQRCDYMHALRRRGVYLISRYEKLEKHAQSLLDSAPYYRRSKREELEFQLRRIRSKLAIAESEQKELTRQTVRGGCPISDFQEIQDQAIRRLFDQASREGVFVDDHVLNVESQGMNTSLWRD